MAKATTISKCALCLAADARSRTALYCAPCHSQVVKRNRRNSAATQRRKAGVLDLSIATLVCARCSTEVKRNSMAQAYCKPCAKESAFESGTIAKRQYAKRNPRKRDKPEDKARRKRWADKNRDVIIAKRREYNERNREEINRKSRIHLAKPETKANRREIDRKYRAKPRNRVDGRMKSAIQNALKGGKAGRGWETLVGYTIDDLVKHLERQFTKGMSWQNMGEWHIDHIRPKISYSYETAEDPDFRACWALTNLRPLWSTENLQKHAKLTLLL